MRGLVAAVLAVMLMCSTAYALGDNENTNTATSSSTATGGSSSVGNGINNFSPNADADARATIERGAVAIDNDNDNINANSNTNRNENRNNNMQGQLQGQLQGQGQTSVGKVKTTTSVNISGDEDSDKAPDAIAFPSVSAAEGTSSGTATYLFGSLGKSNTELYKKIIPQIQTILAIPDDIMDKETKKATIATLVKKMTDSNRTQRFLGIMWEDNSKSLLNLFGLLTWDSLWAEGQKPMQSKVDAGLVEKEPATPKTEDVGVTGNGGNVNQ